MGTLRAKDNTVVSYNDAKVKNLMNRYAKLQGKLFNELYENKRLFFTTNLVGEYAELLAVSKLNLIRQTASNEGYDAEDAKGNKYQIKSRWMNDYGTGQGKYEFGPFKKTFNNDSIDYLVLVVFSGNTFDEVHIYLIDINKDFEKILYLQDKNQLKPKIFGKQRSDGSYKCYYKKESFNQLIKHKLMKEVQ